jgi:hypothetical protein
LSGGFSPESFINANETRNRFGKEQRLIGRKVRDQVSAGPYRRLILSPSKAVERSYGLSN